MCDEINKIKEKSGNFPHNRTLLPRNATLFPKIFREMSEALSHEHSRRTFLQFSYVLYVVFIFDGFSYYSPQHNTPERSMRTFLHCK